MLVLSAILALKCAQVQGEELLREFNAKVCLHVCRYVRICWCDIDKEMWVCVFAVLGGAESGATQSRTSGSRRGMYVLFMRPVYCVLQTPDFCWHPFIAPILVNEVMTFKSLRTISPVTKASSTSSGGVKQRSFFDPAPVKTVEDGKAYLRKLQQSQKHREVRQLRHIALCV